MTTRRFVVIGQRAVASPDFLLADIPGTSGRLDVLLRCVRAALLVSHGVRRDTIVYLVMLGGAPRTLRIDGGAARFVRPDEQCLGALVKNSFAVTGGEGAFATVRAGIAIADGGLETVLADLGPGARYILEEGAPDVRESTMDARDVVFFVGDHLGFDEATRARIVSAGAAELGLGPTSVHAEDAIAIVSNELDRRLAPAVIRPIE